MTHQPSFSQAEFADKKKITRREKFLARREAIIPWASRLTVLEPFYPKGERGRPPIGLERRLRLDFLQQWYGLADEATKEMLKMAMTELNFSARACDRIVKVARTIADLAGAENILSEHISEAIQYRSLDRQLWT